MSIVLNEYHVLGEDQVLHLFEKVSFVGVRNVEVGETLSREDYYSDRDGVHVDSAESGKLGHCLENGWIGVVKIVDVQEVEYSIVGVA